MAPEHQALARANSTNSANHYLPHPIHDSVSHSLTPAQTYQAQVYMNGPNGFSNQSVPPTDWPRTSPVPQERHPHPPMQNGRPYHPPDVKLGISQEHDNDRSGNDFVSGHEDYSVDEDPGEGGSELPWAQQTGTPSRLSAILSIIFIFISP